MKPAGSTDWNIGMDLGSLHNTWRLVIARTLPGHQVLLRQPLRSAGRVPERQACQGFQGWKACGECYTASKSQ